jgi:hypothetical protein
MVPRRKNPDHQEEVNKLARVVSDGTPAEKRVALQAGVVPNVVRHYTLPREQLLQALHTSAEESPC